MLHVLCSVFYVLCSVSWVLCFESLQMDVTTTKQAPSQLPNPVRLEWVGCYYLFRYLESSAWSSDDNNNRDDVNNSNNGNNSNLQ